jgi:transposase
MSVIRFPPYADLRKPAELTWWQRLAQWLKPPPKAPVFRINNPAQWKLERARRKARGL